MTAEGGPGKSAPTRSRTPWGTISPTKPMTPVAATPGGGQERREDVSEAFDALHVGSEITRGPPRRSPRGFSGRARPTSAIPAGRV